MACQMAYEFTDSAEDQIQYSLKLLMMYQVPINASVEKQEYNGTRWAMAGQIVHLHAASAGRESQRLLIHNLAAPIIVVQI